MRGRGVAVADVGGVAVSASTNAAVLRAPCPACGVVDRVVPASPQGGYRMIQHRAPLATHQWRRSICTGKALIPVAAIVAQTTADRAHAVAGLATLVVAREKLHAAYVRDCEAIGRNERELNGTVAATDAALTKLAAKVEAHAAKTATESPMVEPMSPVDDRPPTCAYGCPESADDIHRFGCLRSRSRVVLAADVADDGVVTVRLPGAQP